MHFTTIETRRIAMRFNLVDNNGEKNITVVANDGSLLVADDQHPNFDKIVDYAMSGDERVFDLFDVSRTVATRFDRLSERVQVANGRIYFDGEEVNNSLTRAVVRFLDEDIEDFMPLVNFFEKVMTNPQEHSRDQLYSWLADRDFTITDEGNFLAYKGVVRDSDGKYRSVSSGSAIVDGVKHTGRIPNAVGSVVEMPRSNVQADSYIGCSTGLHAGTWAYASSFGRGGTLLVEINPRDVVSVPTDCAAQKLRVCRYKVKKVIDRAQSSPLYVDEDTDDSPWYDYV